MPVYFAFGSNMSTARLRARVPAAAPLGVASLEGHALRFHKRSQDGSGKADAFRTDAAGDVVWGVLFELPEIGLHELDRAEGSGYERVQTAVVSPAGDTVEAWAYLARPHAIDHALSPFDWYLQHLLDGAREHGLPDNYISRLATVPTLRSTRAE